MSAKHTPGPWVSDGVVIWAAGDNPVAAIPRPGEYGKTEINGLDDATAIAALPRLYDVAVEAIATAEHALMNIRALTGGDERRLTALLAKARSAVALAEEGPSECGACNGAGSRVACTACGGRGIVDPTGGGADDERVDITDAGRAALARSKGGGR